MKKRTCNVRETAKIIKEKTKARYRLLKVKNVCTNKIEKIPVMNKNTIEGLKCLPVVSLAMTTMLIIYTTETSSVIIVGLATNKGLASEL